MTSSLQNEPVVAKRNLFALTTDVVCFSAGCAFLDPNAVLPLLLHRLGATGLLIGIFAAVRGIGFNLPQIFVAVLAHRMPRQKPILAWVAIFTRIPLFLIPLLLLGLMNHWLTAKTVLWAITCLFWVWAAGDGLSYIPWMEIVARSFSDKLRGRFFALTQSITGAIGILIALGVVHTALHSSALPFPKNYALLAFLGACVFFISIIGILFIHEPPVPETHQNLQGETNTAAYLKKLPTLLKASPTFVLLSAVQLFCSAGAISSSFYVLYATRRFQLHDAWAGYFQGSYALGVVTLIPVWAWIGEHYGQKTSIRMVAFGALLAPVIALTLGRISPWAFCPVYALMGGTMDWGLWIVLNHYLLTHTPEKERPAYIALFSLLAVPASLYPLLGGLMVPNQHLLTLYHVPVLFVCTALFTGVGFLLAQRLEEPDRQE